jgi:Tol biopolymer transport system component
MNFHEIDDYTLLAYADGALDKARRAEIAALLEDAPDLQNKLDTLLHLQRGLRSTFDAADLLPTPGPATWARVRRRTASSGWRRMGVAIGAGACAVIVLIFMGLLLRYSEQSRTTAVPTPMPPGNDRVNGGPAPTAIPGIAVTTVPFSAYPDPAFAYPAPAEALVELATSVPRWPNLTMITGTLPIGRMVFTDRLDNAGNETDPCRNTFMSFLQPVPTFVPDQAPEAFSRIFVLSAGDQQPTHIAEGCVPTLSPDGQRVAYSNNGDIFVINADGSQETRLTNDAAHDSFPIWSPDGQRIAFARDGVGTRFLYVMRADGSQQIQLTNKSVNNFLPSLHYSWSPDGQKIAFVVQQASGAGIYIADTDGSRLTALPRHRQLDYWPAWSPDGQQFAFLSESCCTPDGTNAYPPPGGSPILGYMPDGCCAGNIYLRNVASGEETLLVTEGNGPLVWSPDGNSIAFISIKDRSDKFADIYVMTADGKQQQRLIDIGAGGPLVWSPDGQYLTFKAAQVHGSDGQDVGNLAVLKMDGSQLIQLPIKNYADLTWSQ